MSKIVKVDSDGNKPLLAIREFGYDNYQAGGDVGRVYIGTGTDNIALGKKVEIDEVEQKVEAHIAREDNPHKVTKQQLGLGNVDNTSDINKPISTSTQNALNLKADKANTYTKEEVLQTINSSLVDYTYSKEELHNIFLEDYSVYGLTWDSSADTYTRIGDSFDLIQQKMRRCVVDPYTKQVVYYLDSYNSSLKSDGTPANLSGADGEVMVEVPKFYHSYTINGSLHTWLISEGPFEGGSIHPAFTRGTTPVDYRYYGAYLTTSGSSIGLSITGQEIAINRSLSVFRDAAVNRGCNLLDFLLLSAVKLLYLVEYGSFDSEVFLGNGVFIASPKTGATNSLGNFSTVAGSTNLYNSFVSYRGIESFYGTRRCLVDGILINQGVPYINFTDPSTYSSTITDNYTPLSGVTIPAISSSFILDIGPYFLPTKIGGQSSSTSFIPDVLIRIEIPGGGLYYTHGNTGSNIGGDGAFSATMNSSRNTTASTIVSARIAL